MFRPFAVLDRNTMTRINMRVLLKTSFLFVLWTSFVLLIACQPKTRPMNLEIHVHAHKLSVSWNGVKRLTGGMPVFENADLKFHELVNRREDMPDSVHVFEFMHNFKDHVEIRTVISPQHNTIVFWLSPNHSHTKKAKDFIGILFDSLPNFQAGAVFHKYGPVGTWTHPQMVRTPDEMEENDSQFFLWKYDDGMYAAMLPLLGKGYVASIGRDHTMIGAKAYHSLDGHDERDIPMLAIAFGNSYTEVINQVYEAAFGMNNQLDSLKNTKNYPLLFKQLGWCSWNSKGHDISHDTLIEAAKSFQQQQIQVKWMLIDDGWSTVTGKNGKLSHFGADKEKFPFGLQTTIRTLKNDFGIEHVGVWHTLNGYWAGVDPDSELGIHYRSHLHGYVDKVIWTEDEPSVFFLPFSSLGQRNPFFEDWYAYLRNEGVDFIKVDNQGIAQKAAQGTLPFADTAAQLREQFLVPAQHFFAGQVLNCMCLGNDTLHHLKNAAIARSSEDYFPENTQFNLKAGNEAVHVYNNIFNNVWLHPLVWTDFDMFQSHRKHARYHALARVLNNGPIYLTDYAWQHDAPLIRSMCLHDGTLLQAALPLLPLARCLFQPLEQGILFAKSHSGNTTLLGAWNTTDVEQSNSFSLAELGLGLTSHFLLYDQEEQKIQVADSETSLSITLHPLACRHYQIFELAPFVPIGLSEKWISCAGLKVCTLGDSWARIELAEPGPFVAYCTKDVVKISSSQGPIAFEMEGNKLCVENPESPVFTVHFT